MSDKCFEISSNIKNLIWQYISFINNQFDFHRKNFCRSALQYRLGTIVKRRSNPLAFN